MTNKIEYDIMDLIKTIEDKNKELMIDKKFTSIIYRGNNVNDENHKNGIKDSFTSSEKQNFKGLSNDLGSNHFVYIGMCNHEYVIEVGISHYPLSNGRDGDWVNKVELKNTNSTYMNHVMGYKIDTIVQNISKDQLGKEIKKNLTAEAIIDWMNEDYKKILFIPINCKGHCDDDVSKDIAQDFETIIQEKISEFFNIKYLDNKKDLS